MPSPGKRKRKNRKGLDSCSVIAKTWGGWKKASKFSLSVHICAPMQEPAAAKMPQGKHVASPCKWGGGKEKEEQERKSVFEAQFLLRWDVTRQLKAIARDEVPLPPLHDRNNYQKWKKKGPLTM